VKLAVVDTPPRDSAGIAQVMRSASLVVIPTRPATFDLAAISASIIMARELGRPHGSHQRGAAAAWGRGGDRCC
jgi:cellulose biosynthesis protein BcsQ